MSMPNCLGERSRVVGSVLTLVKHIVFWLFCHPLTFAACLLEICECRSRSCVQVA